MIERIREKFSRQRGTKYLPTQRMSRRDKELRQRRFLYLVMGIVTVAVLALLIGGSIWEFVVQPRQVLASVNNVSITRGDYWKYRRYSLLQQIQQYQFFASQNPQYQTYIQQLQGQLKTVKSAPADPTTISSMIDDQLTVQRAGSAGVTITDADLTAYIQEIFAPVAITSPTATMPVNPTAAAWATQTGVAQSATAEASRVAALGTPGAGTPGAGTPGTGTPRANGTPGGTPGTPAGTPTGTPGTPGTPATPGTPVPTPTIPGSATPNLEQALATSTASFGTFVGNLKDSTGMSKEEYIRLIARPELVKMRLTSLLNGQIKDVQPQVHVYHILLATKDGAEQARTTITGGKSFQDVAKEQSTDTSTSPNGGDLGWVPHGMMVKEFEDTAFSLPVGQVSAPVQTKFGWHLILVTERDDNRPLTLETLNNLQQSAYTKWLEEQKTAATIKSDVPASPTPVRQQFEAPPDAPPTKVPTPLPTPTRPPATPGTPASGSTPTP